MCYGIHKNENLIGFARVVTDYSLFAWLADVFVLPEFRGKGYGHYLIESILNDPSLKNIKRWRLATRDAHSFYSKFGFKPSQYPERLMERENLTEMALHFVSN